MRTLLVAVCLAGCAASSPPAPSAPSAPHAPALADTAWLDGTWQGSGLASHWEAIAGARYGVSLTGGSFEISIIDDSDDEGRPAPLTLFSIPERGEPAAYRVVATTADASEWQDARHQVVRIARTAAGWRAELLRPGQPPSALDVAPGHIAAAPELLAADRQFSADTTSRGAVAWATWVAPDGVRWTGTQRLVGDALVAHIAGILAHGTLVWTPTASGARGDVGYTLGTWTFAPPTGAPVAGSYCTIWRRQADGSWKVAFDLGRQAT